jgi:spore germination protein GerM
VLDFNSEEISSATIAQYNSRSFVGSIALTILSTIPDVDCVRIRINGNYLELDQYEFGYYDPNYSTDQFFLNVGTVITLYYPSAYSANRLVKMDRAVSGRYCSNTMRVRELFKAPEKENALGLCFKNLDPRSVMNAVLNGYVLTIDVSQEFVKAVEQLDPNEQTLHIFSIVNTMCEIERIHKVRFTVNGETVEKIGDIYVKNYLFPLYGIN